MYLLSKLQPAATAESFFKVVFKLTVVAGGLRSGFRDAPTPFFQDLIKVLTFGYLLVLSTNTI